MLPLMENLADLKSGFPSDALRVVGETTEAHGLSANR